MNVLMKVLLFLYVKNPNKNIYPLKKAAMKTSFIFLANGFEEIEAITAVDVLRRAGINVKTVSITDSLQVKGAHDVTVNADLLFANTDFSDAYWLILPGGMPGATNLAACTHLNELLLSHYKKNGKIAAICAAPAVVLAPLGITDGKEATCYPGFEEKMNKAKKAIEPVVITKNLITAAGPSAAMQFALAIVSVSIDENTAYEIAAGMLLYPQHHNYFF